MESLTIQDIDNFDSAFLNTSVENITEYVQQPTLFHYRASLGRPIFISTLLHGNEHSGFLALQKLLRQIQSNEVSLNQSLLILIGNPKAAAQNLRMLPGQPDFNRVWSGGENDSAGIAKQIIDYAKEKDPVCCIDIHNNTGKNPFYSCINKTDRQFLYLGSLFSKNIVFFTEPHEVLSMAFAQFCPSITIEAGLSGEEKGLNILQVKLQLLISHEAVPELPHFENVKVFHSYARLRFKHGTKVDFEFNSDSESDYSLKSELEEFNFKHLKAGETVAYHQGNDLFWVESNEGENLFNDFFYLEGNELKVKKEFVPAMLTKNKDVIRDDCFGYIMEDYKL
ncbi:succinylglutamate desuccinylase/aspartoacylase family protein [Bacteriovoracaceae bacterium]|nr:succinylglutamate desuccinylase/aspartoacylase family protein [Bacteriovoracaceae bacterium]